MYITQHEPKSRLTFDPNWVYFARMKPSSIISLFGGPTALARLLDYPLQTVRNWGERENIPSKHHSPILKAAIKNGVEIKPEDFLAIPPKLIEKANGNK